MWTVEKLTQLFMVPSNNEECKQLVDYIDRGWLSIILEEYTPVGFPHESDAYWSVYKETLTQGGGLEHRNLKWSAWHWLKQKGAVMPSFEQTITGGRADVIANDIRCVVECGRTDPSRLMYFLGKGNYSIFALFPLERVCKKVLAGSWPRLALFLLTAQGSVNLPSKDVAIVTKTSNVDTDTDPVGRITIRYVEQPDSQERLQKAIRIVMGECMDIGKKQ